MWIKHLLPKILNHKRDAACGTTPFLPMYYHQNIYPFKLLSSFLKDSPAIELSVYYLTSIDMNKLP